MNALSETTNSGALAIATPLRPDQHPVLIYLASLAPGSRRTMRDALNVVAGIVGGDQVDALGLAWHQLRYQHTAAIRSALADRYAPATANKTLAALRRVLKECWRLGLMDAESYHRAVDLQPVRGSTLPKGRALEGGELRSLFVACSSDRTAAGARDAALLAVLYGAGLRRAEAVALDVGDFNSETGELRIRSGKGHKARLVYLKNGGALAVRAWLRIRGSCPGPLFCPVNKAGRLDLRQMTPQVALFVIRKRAEQAGVQQFSPHDLRRSFASGLLDAGADISAVQQLMGHASVQTTARYDRRGERAKSRAAELLHVPYVAA